MDGDEEYQRMVADIPFLEMMLESQNISEQRKQLSHPPPFRSQSEPFADMKASSYKTQSLLEKERQHIPSSVTHKLPIGFGDIAVTDSVKNQSKRRYVNCSRERELPKKKELQRERKISETSFIFPLLGTGIFLVLFYFREL